MCRVLLHFREQDFVGNRQATLLHVVAWCHMFSVEKGSWRLFFKKAILWHLGKKTRKHKGLGPHLTLDDSHWHRRCRRVQGLCPNGIRGGQGGSSISAWPSLGPKGKVNFGPVFFGPITNSIPVCRVWAFPICFSLCRSYLMLFYGTSLSRWTAVFFSQATATRLGKSEASIIEPQECQTQPTHSALPDGIWQVSKKGLRFKKLDASWCLKSESFSVVA